MKILTLVVLAIVAYLALIYFGNRWHRPTSGEQALHMPSDARPIGNALSVTTWNIGYSALGAKADFLIDGGDHLRVLTYDEIQSAAGRIGDYLSNIETDVILVQENAGASFLTRGVNVRRMLDARLESYGTCYWSDFSTVFAPRQLKINHGMSVYSRVQANNCSVVKLPQDPSYFYGFLKKYYGGLVTRYPVENSDAEWIVINIHLSAFDESAEVRKRQISSLFEFAEREFEAGNYVVIGGDWNMKISDTEFPHQTETDHLFWIYDFPKEMLPSEWSFATDPTVPTVRTLQKPFLLGDNYTMIIDGFVVSPNVAILSVETTNLGFSDTDHHPVSGSFQIR